MQLLHELTIPSSLPVPVHCKSHATIDIACSPIHYQQTMHIELDCHFVREKLLGGLISLSYIPTKVQVADISTKALSGKQHQFLLPTLGVFHAPT